MSLGGGLSVATTADLNNVVGSMESKFDEHRKWCETQIADMIMKLRGHNERIDSCDRESQTNVESLSADLKALRAGVVTNAAFRQQINTIEKRFEHEKEELHATLAETRMAMEKEVSSGVTNLRLKAETLNANCVALTEKSKILEDTIIPALKSEIEEQKQKRLCETQRLESEAEKVKELCDQKISHTAAALRFYVTATATKLREELAPLTTTSQMEEDLKQKETDLRKNIKALEDQMGLLKAEVNKHKGSLEEYTQQHTTSLGQHSKALKVNEITMNNLQSSVAGDLNDIREQLRQDRAGLQSEIADARANSSRVASANDSAIQTLASELAPLRQLREMILERLHVEKFVNLVREWQTSQIPQMTASVKDLEERARKMYSNMARDHDLVCELQKSVTDIRRHFKMFHAIASGLDDKPLPALADPVPAVEDTRLPPITSARGLRTPPEKPGPSR